MNQQEIRDADRRHIWHPYTQEKAYHEGRPPLLVDRAEGCFLFDREGRKYFDGNGSWWVNILGHAHPRLLATLTVQAGKLAHVAMAGIIHEPAARLAAKLAALAPPGLSRVFFSDNGSTAVEVALKMAFHYFRNTGRPGKTKFLALEGAFHGETLGCVSVGGLPLFHETYGPLLFPCGRLPSPALAGTALALEQAERILARDRDETCAVIIEPLVQGVAGMRMHEPAYLRGLAELCRRFDILLIADEVFTGLGRTGTFWAVEQAGVEPNFLCSSKGLSGGLLPFAATLVGEDVYQAFYGNKREAFYYGHSYTGNPLGCALACEAVDMVLELLPGLPDKAARFRAELESLRELPRVRDIRTCGLIGAVELEGGGYLDEVGWRVYDAALERGLCARPLGHVLYLLPMLNMAGDLRADMVGRLHDAASSVLERA